MSREAYRPAGTTFSSGRLALPALFGVVLVLGAIGDRTATASFQPNQEAPSELTVDDIPACAACRITVELLATLGESSGAGMFGSHAVFGASGSDGRLYLHEFDVAQNVKVFNREGSLLDTFGRKGQGPGEFQSVAAVRVDAAGRVYLFDDIARRISVFSPTYDVISTINLAVVPKYDAILLADGQALITAPGRRPETVGFPFHVVSLADGGNVVRSFGSDGRLTPLMRIRRVSGHARKERHIWAADREAQEFRVERWSIDGEMDLALTIEDGWFSRAATNARPRLGEPRRFSEPAINALHEDSEGLLWVFMTVPDPDWEEYLGESPRGLRFNGTRTQGRDTVIEVLNPEEGVLLARTRIDESASPVVPIDARLMTAPRESEDGDIRIELFRFELDGR